MTLLARRPEDLTASNIDFRQNRGVDHFPAFNNLGQSHISGSSPRPSRPAVKHFSRGDLPTRRPLAMTMGSLCIARCSVAVDNQRFRWFSDSGGARQGNTVVAEDEGHTWGRLHARRILRSVFDALKRIEAVFEEDILDPWFTYDERVRHAVAALAGA